MNQQLSMDRAQAVIAYLIQDCNIPVRHVIAPGAMGRLIPQQPTRRRRGEPKTGAWKSRSW